MVGVAEPKDIFADTTVQGRRHQRPTDVTKTEPKLLLCDNSYVLL